jgi:hypothetical protein
VRVVALSFGGSRYSLGGDRIMRERDIFIEALEMRDSSKRAALLDKACQADMELRERVEELLADHERHDRFILDTPPSKDRIRTH